MIYRTRRAARLLNRIEIAFTALFVLTTIFLFGSVALISTMPSQHSTGSQTICAANDARLCGEVNSDG